MKPKRRGATPKLPLTENENPLSSRINKLNGHNQSTAPSEEPSHDAPVWPLTFDPLHFLRCHSAANDPNDCETKVWAAAFQPKCEEVVIATAGGDTVCLTDCLTGRVLLKFKAVDDQFFALSWTVIEDRTPQDASCTSSSSNHGRSNHGALAILAVGGYQGKVTLIDPQRRSAFLCFQAHKSYISSIQFSSDLGQVTKGQGQSVRLFTGGRDQRVHLWELTLTPDLLEPAQPQLLVSFVCPGREVVSIATSGQWLLIGAEIGLYCCLIDVTGSSQSKNLTKGGEKKREVKPDYELVVPGQDKALFDGVCSLGKKELFAFKSANFNKVFVWTPRSVIDSKERKRVKGDNIDKVVMQSFLELPWKSTKDQFLSISCSDHFLCVGDGQGAVWLYDSAAILRTFTQNTSSSKESIVSHMTLAWPECEGDVDQGENGIIALYPGEGFPPLPNCATVSENGKYLVSCADCNLVCIWKLRQL